VSVPAEILSRRPTPLTQATALSGLSGAARAPPLTARTAQIRNPDTADESNTRRAFHLSSQDLCPKVLDHLTPFNVTYTTRPAAHEAARQLREQIEHRWVRVHLQIAVVPPERWHEYAIPRVRTRRRKLVALQ
jgi:hypothetical protein